MSWTIEQVTDGRGRRYVIRNEQGEKQTLPSVTTILGALPKNGLDWWGFKLGCAAMLDLAESGLGLDVEAAYALAKATDHAPHKALKKAGGRGTDVHTVAEVLLRDGTLDELPASTSADEGFVDALVKWHDEHDVASWQMLAVEALLFSQTYGYAGQSDFIARRPDGVVVVGDFKTSKGVYLSHHLQAAAYEQAAREMGLVSDDEPVERHVVRLASDGEFEVQHHPTVSVEDFLCVLEVHKVLKTKERKAVKL
jgi:hypothetical protein